MQGAKVKKSSFKNLMAEGQRPAVTVVSFSFSCGFSEHGWNMTSDGSVNGAVLSCSIVYFLCWELETKPWFIVGKYKFNSNFDEGKPV